MHQHRGRAGIISDRNRLLSTNASSSTIGSTRKLVGPGSLIPIQHNTEVGIIECAFRLVWTDVALRSSPQNSLPRSDLRRTTPQGSR